jgi:hypothetical protein
VILNKDMDALQTEIHSLLADLDKVDDAGKVFLHILDGLCEACIQTQSNLYGFAD